MDPDRSFERIYRRHRRDVYGSVLRDVRDPDEAEDVTQVAFLNAFRAMRRGDEPERPRAWLLTIARNVVRRRARLSAARPQEVPLDADVVRGFDDVEESAVADISAALGGLTDAQREAIVLREIQGHSYAEIAGELGLSVPAVEALIFRARRAVAEHLELLDRAPAVRSRKGRGLLALPGLAKLGSFSFSFGRTAVACLVGCAVIAVTPVGRGDASHQTAKKPETRTAVREAAGPMAAVSRERTSPARAHRMRTVARHVAPAAKRRGGDAGAHQSGEESSSPGSSGSSGLLPSVDLPPVSVPSVELPPVDPPPLELPPVDPPPLPPLPPAPTS